MPSKTFAALIAAFCIVAVTTSAEAKHKRHHVASVPQAIIVCNQQGCSDNVTARSTHVANQTTRRYSRSGASIDDKADPRPPAWCAWWLRRHLHIARSVFPPYQYNMARAFAKIGTPAPKGCTGCIAVFSRGRGGHVGIVENWDANGNPVILSGNFNGRVDTAPHPAKRLLALRWVS